MRRWIFFVITFVTISALFLLASGEYTDRESIPHSSGDFTETSPEDPRFKVQFVDQEENVLLAVLRASGVDLQGGEQATAESIRGARLRDVEIEIYHSGGEKQILIRAPEGRALKEETSKSGGMDIRASLSGGVVVEFPDRKASIRTEALELRLSGTSEDQRRLLTTRDARGQWLPVVLEGMDPFGRIEAGGIEADLSTGSGGEIRLVPPVTARAAAALATGLSVYSGGDLSGDGEVQVQCDGPVLLSGFLSLDGSPGVSPAGETTLRSEGRTKISRIEGDPVRLEADGMTILFVEREATAAAGPGGAGRERRRRVEVDKAQAAGDVELRQGDLRLRAGSVEWDSTSRSVVATGAPSIREETRGREISADRIAFYTDENRVELDGHVAGRITVSLDEKGRETGKEGSGEWRFLAEHLELRMEKDKGTGKLGVSWGEARAKEGRPLVISDRNENTLITGTTIIFTRSKTTLRGGEGPCLLRHGKSRFRTGRVDLDLTEGRVILSEGVQGTLYPEDLDEEGAAEEGEEPIQISADLVALEIRLPDEEGEGEGEGLLPGGGEEVSGSLKSEIRSIRAQGDKRPARIVMGSKGIQAGRLYWDLESGVISGSGKLGGPGKVGDGPEPVDKGASDLRPVFWDDNVRPKGEVLPGQGGDGRGPVKVRLQGGVLEVRTREGKGFLGKTVRGKVTDSQGREWRIGAEAVEVIFTPYDGGRLGSFFSSSTKGGRPMEVLRVRAKGRRGKDLWLDGEPGRLEAGEAIWEAKEGTVRLFGPSGCLFRGRMEGARMELIAGEILLDTENRTAALRGAIRGEILPPEVDWEAEPTNERMRKVKETFRRTGKDPRAAWTIRCENARLTYDVPPEGDEANDGPGKANAAIREFRADGGEGLVVIESKENAIRLAGTTIEYDLAGERGGWIRMRGSEKFPPRLEVGDEGKNVIIAQEIALQPERKELVFEDGARLTFHSESIREIVPEAEGVPGILWGLESERIQLRVGDEWDERMDLDLLAEGPVRFWAGDLEVEAERAVYEGRGQTIQFTGDPVRAREGKNIGTFQEIKCDMQNQTISVKGGKGWMIDPDILKRIRGAKK